MKVFVNPGHDPNVDSGAVNIDYDVREADVTKQAGALLERGLKRAGHEVMLLQSDDLDAVVAAANDWPADILFHCIAMLHRAAMPAVQKLYITASRADFWVRLCRRRF